MNVLVFTSLFPNRVQPNHGIFIYERMARVACLPKTSLHVVAPVPWYPPLLPGSRAHYRQVPPDETIGNLEVSHPRYVMIPKIGMPLHGDMMFQSVLAPVRALHRRVRFDLIDAHYVYPDGYAGVRLGRALGIPAVVSARGSDVNRFGCLPRIRPKLQSTLTAAARVIAVSAALRARMVELGTPASAIDVIPNGVDLGVYTPGPRPETRAKLHLPERKTILYVGNLVSGKGVEMLIDAVALLAASDPALSLVVVGRGPLRSLLERRARERDLADKARFVGEVPHRDLAAWYSSADVACLPSEREGWPNVLLEALACGTPVVATRVGGIPEIISSDRVGLLSQGGPADLAACLRAALAREWDRSALRAHAERFTWERTAEAVGRVFDRAVQGGHAALEPAGG